MEVIFRCVESEYRFTDHVNSRNSTFISVSAFCLENQKRTNFHNCADAFHEFKLENHSCLYPRTFYACLTLLIITIVLGGKNNNNNNSGIKNISNGIKMQHLKRVLLRSKGNKSCTNLSICAPVWCPAGCSHPPNCGAGGNCAPSYSSP